MGVHLVDSNFFIQAHRTAYPFDVVPSFWLKVRDLAHAGHIISIDKVKAEIYGNNDPLKAWCISNLPANFFINTGPVLAEWITVTGWATARTGPSFSQPALVEFLNGAEADAWLVAFALKSSADRIIVTHEVSSPGAIARVKIPDACQAHNVSYCNTIDMFRALNVVI